MTELLCVECPQTAPKPAQYIFLGLSLCTDHLLLKAREIGGSDSDLRKNLQQKNRSEFNPGEIEAAEMNRHQTGI